MVIEECKTFFETLANNETLAQGVTWEQVVQNCPLSNFASSDLIGGALMGSMIVLGITIVFITILAAYVYSSLAWYTIAKKLKYKYPGIAWIPIVNIVLGLQLGGFHWAWIFLIFIPILGWIALFIMLIIAKWHIYEKRKYPGWFSLALIIPKVGSILHLVAIGFVAWQDKPGTAKTSKPPQTKRKAKKKK